MAPINYKLLGDMCIFIIIDILAIILFKAYLLDDVITIIVGTISYNTGLSR